MKLNGVWRTLDLFYIDRSLQDVLTFLKYYVTPYLKSWFDDMCMLFTYKLKERKYRSILYPVFFNTHIYILIFIWRGLWVWTDRYYLCTFPIFIMLFVCLFVLKCLTLMLIFQRATPSASIFCLNFYSINTAVEVLAKNIFCHVSLISVQAHHLLNVFTISTRKEKSGTWSCTVLKHKITQAVTEEKPFGEVWFTVKNNTLTR